MGHMPCPSHITDHKVPPYIVFTISLLSHPPKAQISPSAIYPRTFSPYVPPWMWKIKIPTHRKQQAKLQFSIIDLSILGQKTGRQMILHWIVANIPGLMKKIVKEKVTIIYEKECVKYSKNEHVIYWNSLKTKIRLWQLHKAYNLTENRKCGTTRKMDPLYSVHRFSFYI